jgi:hypothetical protein
VAVSAPGERAHWSSACSAMASRSSACVVLGATARPNAVFPTAAPMLESEAWSGAGSTSQAGGGRDTKKRISGARPTRPDSRGQETGGIAGRRRATSSWPTTRASC